MKPVRFAAFLLLLALSACGKQSPDQAAGSQSELTHIRLPMGYIPNVQYAPFYVAVDKGYYRQAGIELEFDYSFETDGVKLVAGNELQFTLASGDQVLLARAQGLPVVYVMSWWQNYPVGIAAKTSQGIKTPQDLNGRRIGLPILGGASYIGLQALLNAGHIREADVRLDVIGYNQVEALAADQEEAVVIYVNNEPFQLQALGYELDVLRVADYVQLASNGLVSNETTLQQQPELIQRMVDATLRGIQDTLDDPDGAYEICLKYVENLAQADQSVQRAVLRASIEFWRADQLGRVSPQAWENMQAVLLQMGQLTQPLDLERAYTNQFIGK
jgi:NitT/TauT family transport system substrate-binding protein